MVEKKQKNIQFSHVCSTVLILLSYGQYFIIKPRSTFIGASETCVRTVDTRLMCSSEWRTANAVPGIAYEEKYAVPKASYITSYEIFNATY